MKVALALVSVILLGIAATSPPGKSRHRNLKVLPKDISDRELHYVMDRFRSALGVECKYCHAASKDSSIHELDYASDEKPKKEEARAMMRLTNKLNKKFFTFDKETNTDKIAILTCNTCHRGKPRPGER